MSSKTKLWYIQNFNFFSSLSPQDMEVVAGKAIHSTVSKNEYIYFPEDPSTSIFLLKEGSVKLGSYSTDGKEIIKAILQPGEIFGELSLTGEESRDDFAMALDAGTMVCALGLEDMTDMMTKNPDLSLKITKLIGFRLKKIERRLESLVFKDARTRIIDFLKDISEESGKKIGDEILIKHNFTHQDIANLTATSRQTVTTILNELKDQNKIYMERKKILIRNLQNLN